MSVQVNPRIKRMKEMVELDNRDMRVLTKELDMLFRENMRKQFATEGASGGRPWPALSRRYARRKRKKFGSKKILQATGDLRKAMSTKSSDNHIAEWRRVPDATISLGGMSPYGAHHIRGIAPQKKRDFLQMTEAQERGYREVINARLAIKAKRLARVLARWKPQRKVG